MKTCNRCELTKPYTDFYKLKRAPDGYRWECKQCCAERSKQWQQDNPDRKRAHLRASYHRHREKHLAYQKEYAKANPGLRQVINAGQRAKKLGLLSTLSYAEWREVIASHDGLCAICREAPFVEMDHIHPLGAGGANIKENVQPVCEPCHDTKSGTDRSIIMASAKAA